MHSIKSAARKHAWYNDDPKNKSYNMFGRVGAPHKLRDEEADGTPLTHITTDNQLPSPVEQQRQAGYADERRSFNGPRKAGTFPGGPNGDLPRRSAEEQVEEPIAVEEKHKDDSALSGSTKNTSEGENTVADRSIASEEQPVRKRKSKFHIPFTKKKDEGEEHSLSRTSTSASKKKFKGPKPTFMSMLKAVFASWVNVLLICVPIGIALEYTPVTKVAVFVVNFVAIVPLAGMLSYATEELALYVGETLGGLLNASFGNAVELIVAIIALNQGKVLIVQTSLIGSMLSNLLLVMGMCFFFGGLRRTEQFFNVTVAQTAASLLSVAIGAMIVPTSFAIFESTPGGIDSTSRGIAILLLVIYGCYLFFQLKSHAEMYNEPSKKSPKRPSGKKEAGETLRGLASAGAGTAAASGGHINQENIVHPEEDDEEDEGEVPQLTRLGALVTLAGSTVLVAICAEFMVSGINSISGSISQEFIGLILLPIVGNAAEHATAVTVACKDKMDLAIGVAVGSSLQIALLVLPLMVVIGWCGLGQNVAGAEDMTLNFDGFLVIVLVVAVWLVQSLISDGKSHWLEGAMLQIFYVAIAVAAYNYPVPAGEDVSG